MVKTRTLGRHRVQRAYNVRQIIRYDRQIRIILPLLRPPTLQVSTRQIFGAWRKRQSATGSSVRASESRASALCVPCEPRVEITIVLVVLRKRKL